MTDFDSASFETPEFGDDIADALEFGGPDDVDTPTPAAPRRGSAATTAPAGDVPSCPVCGGAMYDNRAENAQRVARGERARPDFKCRDTSCTGLIWPPREGASEGFGAAAAPAGTADDPACPICGGKMWDDRTTKRNPRAPDFKCRNKPKVVGGPGCAGVIWPPRDPSAPAPTGGGQKPAGTKDDPACPTCGGKMWDNRKDKRNPRAPDFKCRDRACAGVIWPPDESMGGTKPGAKGGARK